MESRKSRKSRKRDFDPQEMPSGQCIDLQYQQPRAGGTTARGGQYRGEQFMKYESQPARRGALSCSHYSQLEVLDFTLLHLERPMWREASYSRPMWRAFGKANVERG